MAIDIILRGVKADDAQQAADVIDKVRQALFTSEWPGKYTVKVSQEDVNVVSH